jgi:hypothetical protein
MKLTCPSEICEAAGEPAAKVEVIVTQLQLVTRVTLSGKSVGGGDAGAGVEVVGELLGGGEAGAGEEGVSELGGGEAGAGAKDVTTTDEITVVVPVSPSAGAGEAGTCVVVVGPASQTSRNWTKETSNGGMLLGKLSLLFDTHDEQAV